MKKSTIFTLLTIGVAILFWVAIPAIIHNRPITAHMVNADDTTTVWVKTLDGLTIEALPQSLDEDGSHEQKYNYLITFRADRDIDGISITMPKGLLAMSTTADADKGSRTATLTLTSHGRSLMAADNVEIMTKHPNTNIQSWKSDRRGTYNMREIPITITLRPEALHHLLHTKSASDTAPKHQKQGFQCTTIDKLVIENYNAEELVLNGNHGVTLRNCKLERTNCNISDGTLALERALIGELTFYHHDMTDPYYQYSTLTIEEQSHVDTLILKGNGELSVDKSKVGHISVLPQKEGLDLHLVNITNNVNIK